MSLSTGKCPTCEALRAQAADAVNRHVAATSRRELARLRHDSEAFPALDVAIDEAAAIRERTVAAFKAHLESHGDADSLDIKAQAETTGA